MQKETDPKLRCTSRFAGCRCHLRSGHPGPHHHNGTAGDFKWGKRITKRR